MVRYSIEQPGKHNPKLKLVSFDPNGKPSWKRYFEGDVLSACHFRAVNKNENNDGWLECVAYEHASPNDLCKRIVSKQVFVTMNADQAIALRDYLNGIFPTGSGE